MCRWTRTALTIFPVCLQALVAGRFVETEKKELTCWNFNQRQRISNIIETSLDISFTSQQHSVTPHESNHVTKHNKAALIDTNSPNDKCPGILHKIKHKWWTLRCPSYHTVLYFLCRGCEDSKCVQHVRNHFLCCLVVHLGNLSLQWLSSTSFTGAHWVQVNSSMN